MKKMLGAVFVLSLCVSGAYASEEHVRTTVSDIIANVKKVKSSDPAAVPMAFWDFDGTIICGDISTGHSEAGREVYSGMFVESAGAGFSEVFKTRGAAREYLEKYSWLEKNVGRWLAWPSLGQTFYGADALQLEEHCRKYAQKVLKPWYYASALAVMRELEKAGVENYIVSGSPDVFVKAAGSVAGVPRERSVGIRQRVSGGRLTTQLEYPLSMNEGKVECIREILNARKGAVAVAAFGNSYWTDGPFMRYVAVNPLPGGVKGIAVMVNGGDVPAGYEGLFRRVTQKETLSGVGKR